MVGVSDIIKLLEQIPIWKRMKAAADEIDALKARVAKLEGEITKRPPQETCPLCGTGELKVTKVRADPMLGPVGIQLRLMKCSNAACGHQEERQHDPNGGGRG